MSVTNNLISNFERSTCCREQADSSANANARPLPFAFKSPFSLTMLSLGLLFIISGDSASIQGNLYNRPIAVFKNQHGPPGMGLKEFPYRLIPSSEPYQCDTAPLSRTQPMRIGKLHCLANFAMRPPLLPRFHGT
ncbi:MAG: hypothetical protein M2R45_04532 [Verrucomicrobia subdivision 3 bacterium]|nr:hypothetical protein [Limisphaerales bacterium]MCS1416829.1 hypothetical protein [Limisphaerales bacterium]